MPSKRIAVLTGGGDAPGLNAVLRALVKAAVWHHGWEVFGVQDGFEGFLRPDGMALLGLEQVRGIHARGGTILGAANRGSPFARKVVRDGQEVVEDASGEVLRAVQVLKLSGIVCIGGDGTLTIASELAKQGCPIVGVPKTIDNDLGGTDQTFGFDTALRTATEAIDKLHTTAEAHHRVMVVEVMGRHAGWIALHAAIAGGAHVCLIPEIPFGWEAVARAVKVRSGLGKRFSIVVVAEGAFPAGGEPALVGKGRLGGMAHLAAGRLEEMTGLETRATVLGHLQRGGGPTAFDRILATRYGVAAVDAIAAGRLGTMVALKGARIVTVPLAEAVGTPKRVDPRDGLVRAARDLGMVFGDEAAEGKVA
jgi:6-phosphofructokinase 1